MTEATDAIVLSAGRGVRLGGDVPKQYLPLGGRTVIARALDAFLHHPRVRKVCVAIGPDDAEPFAAAVGTRAREVLTVVGGETRQASVLAALGALASDPPARILIHDGARPFVSETLIARVDDALVENPAVIPAVPVADTLKRVDGQTIVETVSRDGLAQAQTPQGFWYGALVEAHKRAQTVMTDDAGVMEAAGHAVRVVEGERANHKLTTADDLAVARARTGG
ncbi:MAG: 2-C-methyl-D-erythritol 4-phosphate cytidylyltransferase [Pseudomonadota bacterium]